MRPLLPALLVLVAACTSELAAPPATDDAGSQPDASMPDARPDAPVSPEAGTDAVAPLPEAGVDGGAIYPACNGTLRRADCAAKNLPDAYGFGPDCAGNPWLPADGGVAFRPEGLASCIEWRTVKTGDVLECCPE